MIYVGLYTLLSPQGIYYTPLALRHMAALMVANPPFNVDVVPLDAPTAPGKTLPATTLIERLRRERDA